MQHYKMTIDGQCIETEDKFAVINPATGEPFATCTLATLTDVDDAVKAARNAFPDWGQRADSERQHLMHEIAQVLEANMSELAQLLTEETGKPLNGLNGVGANMELMGSIGWSHVTADIELPIEVIQDNDEAYVHAYRKPLGVVASITPWNWPLMIAIWHVIAALRVGNTVVIKPSENSPLSTARFVELANTVLPPGVLNVVTGFGDLGQALVSHDDVNKVVFTGSTETGKKIMASASSNLKRLTLELGGNDAAIVLPDVDVKTIAPELFGAAFHNNGQTCACLKRLYVHEDIYDSLCTELAVIAKQIKVGDGLESDTQLGPLQNEAQLQQIIGLAASIANSGGRILAGGNRIDRQGFFFEPTIVADLTNGDLLVDQEQFGPILPVIKFTDVEHGLELANDSQNGLGGSIWSTNSEIAAELAQRLECGTAWVNSHGDVQPDAPFGGVKQSGIGVEFGRYGLEECTSLHTLKVKKG